MGKMPPDGRAEIENVKSAKKVRFSISALPQGDAFEL